MPQVCLVDRNEWFQAADGETILAAAQRAGVPFPYSCLAGNCGSCKCVLIAGTIVEAEYAESALTPEERLQGRILACRSQVWGDIISIRTLDDA